mgnify:FL=1
MTKKCTKCWEVKALTEFWKNKNFKDWLRYECTPCRKRYTKENKAHIREKSKQYWEENKERLAHKWRQYYKDNKEILKQKQRERWPIWAKTKEWRLSKKLSANKRRALELSAEDWTITPKVMEELLFLQFNKCLICDCDISNGYHMDHIKPLNDWGEHSRYNIQLLCSSCNVSKSDKYNW